MIIIIRWYIERYRDANFNLYFDSLGYNIFFTYFVRKILINAGVTDSPIVTEHRHKTGTPTMGGLAMLLGAALAAAVFFP